MVQTTKLIQNCPEAVQAEATDTAFFFKRQNEELKSGWTSFNEKHSDTDPEVSTVGYMPIVLAPAHDVNTLNTVVQRIMQVAESFNQKHVVLTVDQALFPLLMELKWTLPDYKDTLIPRLGGLHTSMNFLKVLGQHIQDSGLPTIWIESGILGPRTVERALAGKDYNKGTRVHKITLQAMWQLILPQVLAFIAEKDNELKQNLERSVQSNSKEEYLKLLDLLSSTRYQALLSSFITTKKDKNPISSTGGITWKWSAYFCCLSEPKGRDCGSYIYMPFTRCCHFSIVMITPITHDGVPSTLRK